MARGSFRNHATASAARGRGPHDAHLFAHDSWTGLFRNQLQILGTIARLCSTTVSVTIASLHRAQAAAAGDQAKSASCKGAAKAAFAKALGKPVLQAEEAFARGRGARS